MNHRIIIIVLCILAAVLSQIAAEWLVRKYLTDKNVHIKECLDFRKQKLWFMTYIVTAIISGVLFNAYDWDFAKILRRLIVIFTIIAIARIDYKIHIIPNSSILFLFSFQFVLIIIEFFTDREQWGVLLISYLIGCVIAFITFFAGYVISRKGMGMGDLKLMAALGFCLGDNTIVIIILFSLIMAAIYGIYKLLRKEKSAKDEIAYAPFVAVASVVLLLLGF